MNLTNEGKSEQISAMESALAQIGAMFEIGPEHTEAIVGAVQMQRDVVRNQGAHIDDLRRHINDHCQRKVRLHDSGLITGVDEDEGYLFITIGINTLKGAFERSEANNPMHEKAEGDIPPSYVQQCRVVAPAKFAAAVARVLDAGKFGQTPVTRLLDDAFTKVLDEGGDDDGIEDVPYAPR